MRKKESPFIDAERAASSLQYSRTLSPGGMTQRHWHDEFEMAVLVSGRGWCDLPDETLPMEDGQVYLLPPGTPHLMRYLDVMPHVMYHVMFRPSLLEELRLEFGQVGAELIEALNRPQIFQLTEELQRRLEQARSLDAASGDPLDQDIRHMQIKCVLLTMAKQLRASPADHLPTAHPRLAEALRYMQAHYAEELNLTLLARHCGLSAAYLCRLCRAEIGLSPGEYLLRIRLDQACRLLRESRLNISQVALRVGFNSTAYFDRRFREETGLSPGEYVARYRTGRV